jgi:hypothetical protein
MGDFLISTDTLIPPSRLLAMLQRPYGAVRRQGRYWTFPRCTSAALEDPIAHGDNFVEFGGFQAAWVGDAPLAASAVLELLRAAAGASWQSAQEAADVLAASAATATLNGAFAVFACGPRFAVVVTDPISAVQVYAAANAEGAVSTLGTHPDLVAAAGGRGNDIDPVSVGEFINSGNPCRPHTMYHGVTELAPGRVHVLDLAAPNPSALASHVYWRPPAELNGKVSEADIMQEFACAWVDSVRARCEGTNIAVQLSGGLDSRIVMAAIPRSKRCLGLTFCDEINREARIAARVAAVYGREWQVLRRDPEYLARTAVSAIRFTGCEGEWHHAHAIGFREGIGGLGLDGLFTGLFMDNNFKAYYARDLIAVPRLRGLLPPRWTRKPVDYINSLGAVCKQAVQPDIQEAMRERRRFFYGQHFALGRQSEWEWLEGYPLTQASDNTGWIVERRLFPLRLPVNDRRLLDIAFRLPARWKAGGQFFARATLPILGPGRSVPNANDGVRPGCGQARRVAYRAVRKARNFGRNALQSLGFRAAVPHSWHDYQQYWKTSSGLRQLVQEHGHQLQRFEKTVFTGETRALINNPDLNWREAYRFVQLAVWLDLIGSY